MNNGGGSEHLQGWQREMDAECMVQVVCEVLVSRCFDFDDCELPT